jgi:putative membrane protein
MLPTSTPAQRRIPFGGWLWALILLGWCGMGAWLLIGGGLAGYLHPRMTPFVIIASIAFGLLGIVTAAKSWAGKGAAAPHPGHALFLVPLLLSVVGGPRGLDESAVVNRLLKGMSVGGGPGAGMGSSLAAGSTVFRSIDELLSSIGPDGLIRLEDWSYEALIADMGANPDKYDGRRVALLGFAFRPPVLPAQRLYVTRFLITCCVADAEPLGLLVEGAAAAGFEDYDWLTAEGVMGITMAPNPYTGKDERVVILMADTLRAAEKPVSAYLFPFQL